MGPSVSRPVFNESDGDVNEDSSQSQIAVLLSQCRLTATWSSRAMGGYAASDFAP